MKRIIGFKYGGGTFSLIIKLLDNLITFPEYDSIYVDNRIGGSAYSKSEINFFDILFDQKKNSEEITLTTFHNLYKKNIFKTKHYYDLKKAFHKYLKINKNILIESDIFFNSHVNQHEKILGVHIRLTGMNLLHGTTYGVKTFNDFKTSIDKILQEEKIDKIFVASDNNESLLKLKEIYGNVIFHINTIRYENEIMDDININFELSNMNNPIFYQDAMMDAVLLSKCNFLIHRTSGVSLFSLIISDTIEKNYFL